MKNKIILIILGIALISLISATVIIAFISLISATNIFS